MWPTVTIGSRCVATDQRNPDAEPARGFRYVDIASIDRETKRIKEAREVTGAEAPSRARKELKAGDVLVSTVRPNLNAVALVPPELDGQIASTGFCVLRPNRELLVPGFLFYHCLRRSFVDSLSAKARGASYPAVSDEIVKQERLPEVPPREQQHLVDILNRADELRRKRRNADLLGQNAIQSAFRALFGDPVHNVCGWPIVQLGSVVESRLGKMLDKRQRTFQHPHRYLANLNVQWRRFVLNDLREMDFDGAEQQEFALRSGDLLVCEGGEPGRCAIWRDNDSEIYFQKALHRLRVNRDKLSVEYLQTYFEELARAGYFADTAAISTIAHLTGDKLRRLGVPLPPIELQQRFGAQYRAILEICQNQMASRALLETLFQTLLERAFDGRLTAKWREAHAKDLVQEMSVKAR